MAKEKDENDKLQENPQKAAEDFDNAYNSMLSGDQDNVVNLSEHNPDLAVITELNEKHIFIENLGGKSAISIRTYSEVTDREELDFISIETFKNIYMNRTISITVGNTVRHTPIGIHWLTDSRRRTVNSITFDPSQNQQIIEIQGKKYLNIWDGLGIRPTKGCWKKTRKHIWKILCNSDPAKFKYVIKWLAFCVQRPELRPEVAMVFKGEKGAGKSFVFVEMKKIFGPHGMVVYDPNRLTGRFNFHFRNLCYLFCDEAYLPGDKEVEGVIKARITEGFIDCEPKGRDSISLRNCLSIVMCTNKDLVIPATKDERRFFIEDINNMYAKNRASDKVRKAYFDPLWSEMENGGRAAMLYDLQNIKLGDWHPRDNPPDTKELSKQKTLNLNSLESAVKSVLEDGLLPGELRRRQASDNDEYWVMSASYVEWIEKLEPHCTRFSLNRKTDIIKKLGAIKHRQPGTGKIVWIFPELNVMRKLWDENYGPNAWDDLNKWVIQKSEF